MKRSRKPFFGREEELSTLRRLLVKRSASLFCVRGRRRIGKSRLLAEFGKEMKTYFFSGIPPTKKTTPQSQRDTFASQMAEQLQMLPITANDWTALFSLLAERTRKGRVLVVFDEISWIGSKDPDFLGKLKNAWDLYFSDNPSLLLALCGSVSTWIEKNILSNTGFVGRISIDLVLSELPLKDCAKFWRGKRVSPYEIFKILSVTGGIPKYLEEMIPESRAEENIRDLCFTSEGLLFREFDQIFSALFSKRSLQYGRIVRFLADRFSASLEEIVCFLQIQQSGKVSRYLHHLILSGFVSEDPTWNLKTSQISKLKKFRLKDNYLRFYLKYIEPYRQQIEKNLFQKKALSSLPEWSSIMGLQFENLVLNQMHRLFPLLKLETSDVLMAGSFFQRRSFRQRGCQVDLLIQARFKTLFLCEIKFHSGKIGIDVVDQVKKKIESLALPRGYSVRPVLIHVNGVEEVVLESDFFDSFIDFSQLLS